MLPNYSNDPLKYFDVLYSLTLEQLKQEWKPTNQREYYRMLEVLPPIRYKDSCFMVGECMTHTNEGAIYQTFIKVGDQYWTRPAYLHTFSPSNYREEIKKRID